MATTAYSLCKIWGDTFISVASLDTINIRMEMICQMI